MCMFHVPGQMLISFAADGFANAGEALVGEAIGQKDGQTLRTLAGWESMSRSSLIPSMFLPRPDHQGAFNLGLGPGGRPDCAWD